MGYFSKICTNKKSRLNLVLTLPFFLFCLQGLTQSFRFPVVARVSQKAPYPIYLQDYANPSQSNFSIQLESRDNTLPTRSVRLRIFISGPAGVIQSTPVVRNEKVIDLSPGELFEVPSVDVANYFESYNLLISPDAYSQSLVDGLYQFGVEVIDVLTNRPLSSVQYAPPVWLVVNEPPVLQVPDNEGLVMEQNPAFINFQWVPRHKNVSDVSYEFTLTEINVPLNYTGNIQNLFFSQPPVYTELTPATQIGYDFSKPPLLPDKIYAWRVRAIAKEGLEEIGMFRNNGFSEIRWFRYMSPLNAPFNVQVSRVNESSLKVNWEGFDNHENFEVAYKLRGEANWQNLTIPRNEIETGFNLFEEDFGNCFVGNYEFKVGAKADFYEKTAFSEVIQFKDSTLAPFNIQSSWRDSTSAFLRWSGNQAHTSFRLEYKHVRSNSWQRLESENGEFYSISKEYFDFGSILDGIRWDSSYVFRVIGIDFDGDEATSRESYLPKKKKVDSILKLKEKRIYGTVKWAFLRSEEALGAVSGTPELNKNSLRMVRVSNDTQAGFKTYALPDAQISLFADSTCTILIKQIQTNSFGEFDINFPIEALRGGDISKEVYLRLKDGSLGTFIKKVRTDFASDAFQLNDWVVPARTYRLRVDLSAFRGANNDVSKHRINIYRRISEFEKSPILKYEHFEKADLTPIKINNELYYRVAQILPGQVASGLFFTEEKKRQELLLEHVGPSPFQTSRRMVRILNLDRNGVILFGERLFARVTSPYFFGNILSENGLPLNASDLRLELKRSDQVINTSFPDANNQYKLHVPISKISFTELYQIDVYYQGALAKTVSVRLNPDVLENEFNIRIQANRLVGVLLQLNDENNSPLTNTTVLVSQKSYKTNSSGWLTFIGGEGSTVSLQVLREGFLPFSTTINVVAQTKSSYEVGARGGSLREAIRKDLSTVTNGVSSFTNIFVRSSLSNFLYRQLFELEDPSSNHVYGGLMLTQVQDKSTLKPFELTFKVIDKNSKRPLPNVSVLENNLDALGNTDANGNLVFKTSIGRGSNLFNFKASNSTVDDEGNNYGDLELAYSFPKLNSNLDKATILVELESGALITGTVFKNGTTTPIPNAKVNIEYPGLNVQVQADAQGKYSYRFNPTINENFLTLTTTAEGFSKRTLYIATARSYSSIYNRDIYLNPGGTEELEPEVIEGYTVGMLISLHGYLVRKITQISSGGKEYSLTDFKKYVAIQPQPWAWNLSGQFIDKQGRIFNFEGAIITCRAQKVNNTTFNIFLDEILSEEIPVTTARQNRKFLDAIQISESEPLFLGPQYLRSTAEVHKPLGVIYANKLTLDPNESIDLKAIFESSEEEGGYHQITYSTNLPNYISNNDLQERLGKREFIISHSQFEEPVTKFELFAGEISGEEPFNDLLNYYNGNTASQNLARQYKSLGARRGTGLFYFNNVLFKSFSISNKGPQINKAIVLPIVSIDNIQIDLLNIDFIRLSDNKIKDILIDYSYSPRKLSMGEDVVRAQIEEVIVEEDGVDVVYFTNVGENVIDIKSPNMTPINYNANGIFYSDYKRQKEIVQTAAILNQVEMYQIDRPAMGPGMRMKVSSLMELASASTGYMEKQVLENAPRYASTSFVDSYMPMPEDKAESNQKLEGLADISMDPHVLKTFWKYDDKKKEWEAKLRGFTSSQATWGDVFRPTGIEVQVKDSSDVSLSYEEGNDSLGIVDFDRLKGAELKVNYGVSIPALSTLEVVCEAKFNPEKKRFVRSTITGKTEVTIPEVFEAKIGAAILLDSVEAVSGVFISGEVNFIVLGGGGSLAGGYACVENEKNPGKCDIIWGFQAGFSLEDGAEIGKKTTPASGGNAQPPFVLYGAKFGYLYDQATESSFLLASASMGFGRQEKFDAEILQVMPDSKQDTTTKNKRRNEAVQRVRDLEAQDGDLDTRKTKAKEKEDKVKDIENELDTAKKNSKAKKEDKEQKQADKKAKQKEYDAAKEENDKAQKKLNKLLDDGDEATRSTAKTNKENQKTQLENDIKRKKDIDKVDKEKEIDEATSEYEAQKVEATKKYTERNKARQKLDSLRSKGSKVTEAQIQEAEQEYEDAKRSWNNASSKRDSLNSVKVKKQGELEELQKEIEKDEKNAKKLDEEIKDMEEGLRTLQTARNKADSTSAKFQSANTAKTQADSDFDVASTAYRTAKDSVSAKNRQLNTANSELKDANKAIDEYNKAISDSTRASKSYTKAVDREARIDSTDSALKKRYSETDSSRYKGVKAFALESLFVIATGRSPFDPKEHKFTVDDAELTISTGKTGTTITGAGEFGMAGRPLFTAALMIHGGAPGNKVDTSGFRIFLAMPSLELPKLGPITDIVFNLQLEIGNGFYKKEDGTTEELGDFLIIGSLEGTVQVASFLYVNANARIAIAAEASTNKNTIDNRLAAGANLSETARKIVKFFGSSFNTIAEEAINQRMSFFGALPEQYLKNGRFSGFYVGAKASVLRGILGDFDVAGFFAGSYRLGLGIELGMGILKSFGTDSWEFRLGINPIIELTFRMRAPIEAVLIDERIDYLSKFCLATGYNAATQKEYIKLLYTIIKVDRIIGEPVSPGAEVVCNSYGFLYVKPCVGIFVRYNSEKPSDNGTFVDTKFEENPQEEICPIEW